MARRRTTKPEVLERETEVVKLRRTGLTWDMIAERIGYASASAAHAAYQRAAKRLVQDDIEAIRKIESERLDILQSAVWLDATLGEIPAIMTVLKIQERRAKLLGLDQPFKQQIEVTNYDGNTIDREVAKLVELLDSSSQGALDASTGTTEPTAE